MSNRLAVKGKATFLLLWIGVSALGWFLVPINTLYPTLKTYWEVANRALAYTACGLIIGLVIGIGQFLVLKQKLYSSNKWFFMTLTGYTLAWPIGLAISTLIPAIAFTLQGSSFLPLREPVVPQIKMLLSGCATVLQKWSIIIKIGCLIMQSCLVCYLD
jgi:hypothetical protein